jgi:transposase
LYAWRRQRADRVPDRDDGSALIPVAFDPEPVCETSPEPLPVTPPARARITFPDGTWLEIGADYPAAVVPGLIVGLRAGR